MGYVKGSIEASIQLQPNNCYMERTGRCSLELTDDFFISGGGPKMAADELLYCPRLYQAMLRDRTKPLTVTPCECGHGEVAPGMQQRACIASHTRLPLLLKLAKPKPACRVCGEQISFDTQPGARIVTLRAAVETEE